MRILRILAFVLAALSIGQPAFAQGISNLPRQDTIIIENPQGTITNPTWFNIWVVARGASRPAYSSSAWTRSGTLTPTPAWTA